MAPAPAISQPFDAVVDSGGEKFGRTFEQACSIQGEFIDSQLSEGNMSKDVRIVCGDGGMIRCHAVLLAAVSPFLRTCIESQGDNYLSAREIMLPDYTLSEVKPMLQLLYGGTVQLSSEEEMEHVKALLVSFQIDIQDDLWTKRIRTAMDSSVPAKYIEIRAEEPKKRTANFDDDKTELQEGMEWEMNESLDVISTPVTSNKRLRQRPPPRSEIQTTRSLGTDEEMKISKAESVTLTPKPVPGPTPRVAAKASTRKTSKAKTKKEKKTDATNKEEWQVPKYEDREWFNKEVRRCQLCNKNFDAPVEASVCITGHNLLRCYFCFSTYSSTNDLFNHFRKHHGQAEDDSLQCPFCDETVPLKLASSHVISLHVDSPNSTAPNGEHAVGNEEKVKETKVRFTLRLPKPKQLKLKRGSREGSCTNEVRNDGDLATCVRGKGRTQRGGRGGRGGRSGTKVAAMPRTTTKTESITEVAIPNNVVPTPVCTPKTNTNNVSEAMPGSSVSVSKPKPISNASKFGLRKLQIVLKKIPIPKTAPENDGGASAPPKNEEVAVAKEEKEEVVKPKEESTTNSNDQLNYYVGEDGKIRMKNIDVTIHRQGIDGKLWTWRIVKNGSK